MFLYFLWAVSSSQSSVSIQPSHPLCHLLFDRVQSHTNIVIVFSRQYLAELFHTKTPTLSLSHPRDHPVAQRACMHVNVPSIIELSEDSNCHRDSITPYPAVYKYPLPNDLKFSQNQLDLLPMYTWFLSLLCLFFPSASEKEEFYNSNKRFQVVAACEQMRHKDKRGR